MSCWFVSWYLMWLWGGVLDVVGWIVAFDDSSALLIRDLMSRLVSECDGWSGWEGFI